MWQRPASLLLLLLLTAGCAWAPKLSPAPPERAQNAPLPVGVEVTGTQPAIDGPWLLVDEGERPVAYNLETGKRVAIPAKGPFVGGVSVGGGKVVWADLRDDPAVSHKPGQLPQVNQMNWQIMLYDLVSGKVRQVTHDKAAQINPHTDGKTVVWEDFRHDQSGDLYGYPEIYAYDLATGQERRLSGGRQGGQFQPRVSGNRVVWKDGRNVRPGILRGCGTCPENNWDIYGFDLTTDREFPVATAPTIEDSPDLSGERVVWVENHQQVWLLDLKTGRNEQLTSGAVGRSDARIDGDRVVWMDTRRGHSANDVIVNGEKPNADIFLYDLTKRSETRLTGDWVQMWPAISGSRVAFVYSTQINPVVQVVEMPR